MTNDGSRRFDAAQEIIIGVVLRLASTAGGSSLDRQKSRQFVPYSDAADVCRTRSFDLRA
jgi:hypothetical protein